MKRVLPVGLVAALLAVSVPAAAFDPFVITDIRVEGIQRTEAGTVFNYLPVRVGDRLTEAGASASIKALYATGFFRDVRIEADGSVMVVVVDERPAIAQVNFEGVKEFDKDGLKAGLKEVGLAESRIFDRALLDRAEQELKRQYLSRGLYSARIKASTTPLERNRVAVNFEVVEGEVAKIRKIGVVGNKAFDDETVLELFQLTTPGWLTWYTKNDQYSKQKLSADLERLRSFYLDQGYLDFSIDATQVSISADKRDVFITVNVTEGEKYTISGVRLTGDLILDEKDYRELVTIRPGETFSRRKLTETNKAITDRLGDEGYAFANVNASPEVDRDKREVAFTIFVDPGRRVYVRRIDVSGNTRTRDEVVRREMRQMESGWYDASKINRSRTRVERLGFFDEVNVETPPVPGTTDQVDVNFSVKERPTGNLMFGAGFSSSEKIIINASISQQNLFGSGNSASLSVNTSRVNKTLSLSFTNPYFTVDGVSFGWDIYQRNVDPTSLTVARYETDSIGGGIRFGYPIAEDDKINFGLAVDRTKITTFDDSPDRYKRFCDDFDCESVTSLIGTIGWSRDGRDSFLYPTKGTYQRVLFETALPPGTLRYGKLIYEHQRWFPIGSDFSLMLNGEIGWAKGWDNKPLPFYKSFYAGGIGSVRGFEQSSLGPQFIDSNTGDRESLGGDRRVIGNAEFYFPVPGSGRDKSFRISAFVDAGQVYGEGEPLKLSELRYSSGLAFSWSSPIGPLKFSLGWPLNKEPEDRTQRFQFQLGSIF
ncbi:MAG: outer membrane protein assembly factor BamA [Zoogloeaceae bacterium]|nr:outer membrane protein assembly factor BamA [Rhodocyclaceae bacterium]MCP5236175.1 outer membrane protein assembly factor BamA [Zoogloeaceae bacterium]